MKLSYRTRVIGLRTVAVVIFVGGWLYLQGPGGVSRLILPELGEVGTEIVAYLTATEIYTAAIVTVGEILGALAIAGTLGFVVGFWGARTELRAGVLEPLLVWGYLVPIILFYPLFVLWFGIGIPSKIAYAAASAFFPVAFNCLRGFRRVDARYIAVGRAFGATARQLDWTIKFRAALPVAAAGLKIGAALCMVTVIVAEMLASTQGLGYLIQFEAQSFNTAQTYAAIAAVLVIVGAFQYAIQALLGERRRAFAT